MIKTSKIIKTTNQPHNRKYVTEEHELNDGRKIIIEYLADSGLDIDAKLLSRIRLLEEQLQKEIDDELFTEKFKKVLKKRGDFIESLTINNAKQVFSLDTDEEAQILKTNLK